MILHQRDSERARVERKTSRERREKDIERVERKT